MESFRKYASLPDVDEAPDVYESVASAPLPTVPAPRSPSVGSTHSDEDNHAESGVVRQKIQPGQARNLFGRTKVDTSDVDFSDRLVDKRKSYRVRNGKRRQRESAQVSRQLDSSDEEIESVDNKIARLRREVEELQEVMNATEQAKANGGEALETNNWQKRDTVLDLSEALDNLQMRSRARHGNVQDAKFESPATSSGSQKKILPGQGAAELGESQLLQAQVSAERVLAKATTLESRLNALESVLGSSHTLILSDSQLDSTKSILSTMAMLEAQFTTISAVTSPSLEAISTQITELKQNAARLEETRKAATQAAHDAIKAKSLGIKPSWTTEPNSHGVTAAVPENLDLVAKVDALYATLPTIETVAPLLPGVIERLRSLQVLHTDAATAELRLAEVEQRQSKVSTELASWRDGLERMEKTVRESDGVSKSNMAAIEEWVKELEKKMDALG